MRTKIVAIGIVASVLFAGCAGNEATTSRRIPQPAVKNAALAPDGARVDLNVPVFSNPTTVTNPLFPVSKQESILMLGKVDGKRFRTEVTLMPFTRIIDWEGQRIETLVSQYVAYLDGRLQEVAYDLYAQADDGSVWYFGEDVADFENGVINTTEGTWLTTKDGPAAMIMPGHPNVGNVFRTENIPGYAFEEVTVAKVGRTVDGPLGKVSGAIFGSEVHYSGGNTEGKTFAPGYGEFLTSGGGDVEALALAVPTDRATSRSTPAELNTLAAGADRVFAADTLSTVTPIVADLRDAWTSYTKNDVPRLIEPRMDADLGALETATSLDEARQAAIDVAQSALDLKLRYRPATEIDLARFHLWLTQLLVDHARKDDASVNGDTFTLDYIRDRIQRALSRADLDRLNVGLQELQENLLDGDLDAAATSASKLRESVGRMRVA